MTLSIDIIIERLPRHQIEQICGSESKPTLASIRLMHRQITRMEPQYLYLCTPEDLERLTVDMAGITVVCCGTPRDYSCVSPDCNFYVVYNETDLCCVFNLMEEVFSFYREWDAKLNELVSSMASLQSFIDASDPIFDYPVSLMDYAESTLAYSKHKESDDIVWAYTKEGHIRTEYLLRDNVHSCDIADHPAPLQLYTTASNRYVLFRPIIVYQHTVAFLVLTMRQAGKTRFSRATEQLMEKLAQAITARMRADEFYGLSMGMASEYFLTDLISRKLTDQDVIADRAQFLNQDLEQKRRVICLEWTGTAEPKNYTVRSLRESAHAILPGLDCCIYQSTLVFIEKVFGDEKPVDQAYPFLRAWVEEQGLVCGISSCFSALPRLPDYFEQAKVAARFGQAMNPEDRFHNYSTYCVMHQLELLEQQVDLQSMIHPILRRLISLYGEDHVMVQTLWVYLQNERNLTNAAKQLFVHRNSLQYRVDQLVQKLGTDFSQPEERVLLLNSFEILRYLNQYRKVQRLGPEAPTTDADR